MATMAAELLVIRYEDLDFKAITRKDQFFIICQHSF